MSKTMFNNSSLSYLVIALGLTCSTAAYADYFQNQTTTPQTKMDTGSSKMSDQILAKKVRDKLSSGWFSTGYDQITIDVNNGVVTLTGSVKTWDDKEKVAKEVRNIEGVQGLQLKIATLEPMSTAQKEKHSKFTQDTYATAADEQLNKKIRDNVSSGWLWDSYEQVTLNTANGIVTLGGTVNNIDDQQKLMREIQKIDGVRSVKSDLTIKDRTNMNSKASKNSYSY